MILKHLSILNYKNIREAELSFSDKINCFVGLNGQGKTNLLDSIYLLSFTKSAFNATDSQNIMHEEGMAMVRGQYENNGQEMTITCGLKRGVKKQFRLGQKDYQRLIDHIGLIPLVMVSPEDSELIAEGSDERRRFMDIVIAQYNKEYLEKLNRYNALLKQRNSLLKTLAERVENLCELPSEDEQLLGVLEEQMTPLAEYIFAERTQFIGKFLPVFQNLYEEISDHKEQVTLRYISQLQDRNLAEAYPKTRQRDMILGWTSQGIHKDELEMQLGEYPLKRVGSQGQQKTYLMAMKLAQAVYLGKPILLLDDIFDKLDAERVQRIVEIVNSERFGQIFITDTDRQHLTQIVGNEHKIFHVNNGQITQ